ncbi:hypothetical protein [Nocardioides albidus]|uniref:hypothetical protein n=1 Tax=Nocardioides albidus TaxID=1517589 RepID=UPI00130512A1|nr:hypothetical protein [Nocardioides albidus]
MSPRTIATRAAAVAALLPLIAACSDDDVPATAPDSSSAAATPTEEAVLPDGVLALPERAAGETSVDLDPGRYHIALDDTLSFDVDLPAGTTAHDDGLFLATPSFVLKTELAGDQYGVPRDPCTDQVIEPTGTTVEDLVAALSDLPAYEVSPPRATQLGGADGAYLEVRLARTYDDASCTGGAVQLPSNPETAVSGPAPYLGRWWVLDVDGRRVVVQQNCWGCTRDEFDTDTHTTQSITFTPGS